MGRDQRLGRVAGPGVAVGGGVTVAGGVGAGRTPPEIHHEAVAVAADGGVVEAGVGVAGAVEPEGILDYDLAETEIASAMVAQSRAVTILADSSKLLRSALFQVCPLTDVDRLVVDRAPGGPIAEALQAAAVEVIVTPTADTVVKIA